MLKILTGRSRLLSGALAEALRTAPEETQIIVVPRQLTLQTERMLLDALELEGTFRLQVVSAERFCARIFEAAGAPEGARIDDRGRVLLVREATKAAAGGLGLYRGAEHNRGFAQRAADQLEQLRQARLTPEELDACAADMDGRTAAKLRDLARILEGYQARVEGRYMDGEGEMSEAIARVGRCGFLRGSAVWFFGWTVTSPMLNDLIAATAQACPSTAVFLPLDPDPGAPDADVFRPFAHSRDRLARAARLRSVSCEVIPVAASPNAGPKALAVPGIPRHPDLEVIARGLFAEDPEPSEKPAGAVSLASLRSPREECAFAAALARRLVLGRGWQWNDVLVLLTDAEGYAGPLRAAFDVYGVPLSFTEGRCAARHPVSECLISALRLVEKGFLPEDMIALLHTDMLPVPTDDAERFCDYITRYGLKGGRFFAPLRRGDEETRARMEPIRARVAAPLDALKKALGRAKTLDAQLRALFGFLADIGAWARQDARVQSLIRASRRETAGEEAQVWNRLMGTLDQMKALMSDERLPINELREHLADALSASVIKTLPTKGGAVGAQSVEHFCAQPVRAVLILGVTDGQGAAEDGLLTAGQRQEVAQKTDKYLGPTDADRARLRRCSIKCALDMATDFASVSYPVSGADGAAQSPGAAFTQIHALFPASKIRGGVLGDPGIERMLRAAPRAAVTYIARALSGAGEGRGIAPADASALAALVRMGKGSDEIALLRRALSRGAEAQAMRPETAGRLYGALRTQSVTSLESFAGCPFSYYAKYGLRPRLSEAFELTRADEGTFFHSAVQRFVERSACDLSAIDDAEAVRRMDGIAKALLDEMAEGPLGDTAVSLARRRALEAVARTSAVQLARHMRGSLFRPARVEAEFGPADGDGALTLPGGCALMGKIDRVDVWEGPDARWLRVIDYKSFRKEPKPGDTYYGLRLQLPIYLAAAQRAAGAFSAGVYYLPILEDFPATQETDPGVIEAERAKQLKMSGILPGDADVCRAMTPDPDGVFGLSRTKDGGFGARALVASQDDFDRLVRCALRRAAEHLEGIRDGTCAPAPVSVGNDPLPCQWCGFAGACLFDTALDAATLRRGHLPPIRPKDVFEILRAEEEEA